MSDRERAWRSPHGESFAVRRVARCWSWVVAFGMLLSQVFALGHLVLVTHARCEHGALIHASSHSFRGVARPTAAPDGSACIASRGDREQDHDHCDPFATPPALASVKSASADTLLTEAPPTTGVGDREAERSLPVLSVAPKTSPTA